MNIFWNKHPNEAFESDYSCLVNDINYKNYIYHQSIYYLPESIIQKLSKIENYFRKLDSNFEHIHYAFRNRSTDLDFLDFIIYFFDSLEHRIESKQSVFFGSEYRCPIPYIAFNYKKLAQHSVNSFEDIFLIYRNNFEDDCQNYLCKFNGLKTSKDKLRSLAKKYHTSRNRLICFAVCLAYDICLHAGPDCWDAFEFFVNERGTLPDDYYSQEIVDRWNSAYSYAFMDSEDVFEKLKLQNLSAVKITVVEEKYVRIADVKIMKHSNSKLAENGMLLKLGEKNERDSIFNCGFCD